MHMLAHCVSVMLLAHGCIAQSPPPPPGPPGPTPSSAASAESTRGEDPRRGEREAFFDAMREFLPHKELFDLVKHASVREEIGLSADDAAAIERNVGKSFEAMHDIRRGNEGKVVSADELKGQVRKALAPLNDASYQILEKADLQRLLGIYVQARSYRALLNDRVASQIGLEGESLLTFRRTRNESWQTIMEDMREAMKREIRNAPPGVPPSRDAIGRLFKQAEDKLDLKLAQQLSIEQKSKLAELKGAPFDLPKYPFSFGPPRSRSSRGPDNGPDGRGSESRGSGERKSSSGERSSGERKNGGSEVDNRECKPEDGPAAERPFRKEQVLALPRR